MLNRRRFFESMLFDDITTNRTDFNAENARINIHNYKTEYQEPRSCLMTQGPPLKDVQAMTDWKDPRVPFDVYGKAKDIVRTNPRDVQKPFTKLIDHERKAVQMTRPRLVMTPATSLDDFEDKERETMIDNIYKSTAMEMSRCISRTDSNIEAPRPGQSAPPRPITIPQLSLPYVPREWRMDSVSWDGRQLRGACNPDAMFWLDRPPRCMKCDETKAVTAMRKNKTLK